MTADYFAHKQYRDFVIYKELAAVEKNASFKQVLESLIDHEYSDFEFWRQFSSVKEFKISRLEILIYRFMRRLLGLTFTAKFLEGREKGMIHKYNAYLETVRDPDMRSQLKTIIDHEVFHEGQFISQVKEEKLEFLSSMILGINDGLIELTGAMVGFAIALQKHFLVAFMGLITGIAASLSMASSAFMQARYEQGKNPHKAAVYTGMSYFCVAVLLILPFLLLPGIMPALCLMLFTVFAIIALISIYTSIILNRDFLRQFVEMTLASVGVATVTFLLGIGLRSVIATR